MSRASTGISTNKHSLPRPGSIIHRSPTSTFPTKIIINNIKKGHPFSAPLTDVFDFRVKFYVNFSPRPVFFLKASTTFVHSRFRTKSRFYTRMLAKIIYNAPCGEIIFFPGNFSYGIFIEFRISFNKI